MSCWARCAQVCRLRIVSRPLAASTTLRFGKRIRILEIKRFTSTDTLLAGRVMDTFGEVLYAIAPKAVDQILHMAYKVFPDSAASKGEKDPDEKASVEQIAMANIMRGVHW